MTNDFIYAVRRLSDSIKHGQVDAAVVTQVLQDLDLILETYSKTPPVISNNTADFYTLLLQLREYLRKEDTWKDFYVSSTGTTILEVMAAIGTFLQNAIQVAFREGFPDTANRASSIYAATRLLGVRISRKVPAKVKVWLRRDSAQSLLTVPPYTQFVVGGLEFFNDIPIRFPLGESVLPITVGFDQQGNPVSKNTLQHVYLAQIEFPDPGQIYYPCKGSVIFTSDKTYHGTIYLENNPSSPDSAVGTINFDDQVIVDNSVEFRVYLSQYTGKTIQGHLKFNSPAFIRLPATFSLQFRRTGAGSSIITPASGSVSLPQESVIVSNEDEKTIKETYLKPEYLDRPVVVYDNDLYLYSGRVAITEHVVENISDFYSIRIGYPGFYISDAHVYVEVYDGSKSTVWQRAFENSLLNHGPEDQVYIDETLGDGDCQLTFGNGLHGKALDSGWIVGIRYVLTKGQVGNNGSAGTDVVCSSFNIVGQTLTAPYGGSDEKSPAYYRAMSSTLFRGNRRAVTGPDHLSLLLSYPNVADVAVLSQKELAPYDLRFMNRLAVAVLPQSPNLSTYPVQSLRAGRPFDETIVDVSDDFDPNRYRFTEHELLDYRNRFAEVSFAALDLDFFVYPKPRPVFVKVRIFVNPQYYLDLVSAETSQRIKSLFRRSAGIMGRSLLLSDITRVCNVDEIDYIELILPSSDLVLTDSPEDRLTFFCLSDSPEIIAEYTRRR